MTNNSPGYRRRSIRLRQYDYAQGGAYFVTICTQSRAALLGQVTSGKVVVNKHGQVAEECWRWLAQRYPHVELDQWIVMPNHIHGIVLLTDYGRGGSRTAPTRKRKPLGRLVGAFKTTSAKSINLLRGTPGAPVWQRNYYEHVVRNEDDLNEIRQYILNNPVQWDSDEENPDRQVGARHAVPMPRG